MVLPTAHVLCIEKYSYMYTAMTVTRELCTMKATQIKPKLCEMRILYFLSNDGSKKVPIYYPAFNVEQAII